MRLSEQAFDKKKFAAGILNAILAFRFSPKLAFNRLTWPPLLEEGLRQIENLLLSRTPSLNNAKPRYADGWIGPNFAETMEIPAHAKRLTFDFDFLRPRPAYMRVTLTALGPLSPCSSSYETRAPSGSVR